MIRRILIPLDESPYTDSVLRWAFRVAKVTKAELTGQAMLDIAGIEKSIGAVPVGGIHFAEHLVEAKKQDAFEHIRKMLDNFKDKCEKEGVAYRLANYQGSPSDRISMSSMYYDLVGIGLRTFYSFEEEQKPGSSLEDVLCQTITPIVALPEHFSWPEDKIKMVVAYDGSLPSARALHRFTEFVDLADFDITILMSHKDRDFARLHLNKAEAYLTAHGFSDIHKVWTSENIIEIMENQYLVHTTGIVLGVHSRSPLVSFFVGSLSRYLIQRGDKVLFLGQ